MKSMLGLFLVSVVLAGNYVQAQETELTDSDVLAIQHKVLIPFFKALQSGNISTIKKYISPELYEKNQVLLDENTEYSDFLKNYYKDVDFRIVSAKQNESDNSIIFSVAFDVGETKGSIHELKLSRSTRERLGPAIWVIDEF